MNTLSSMEERILSPEEEEKLRERIDRLEDGLYLIRHQAHTFPIPPIVDKSALLDRIIELNKAQRALLGERGVVYNAKTTKFEGPFKYLNI